MVKIIQKIEREQILLEEKAMEAALTALGIQPLPKEKVMDDFRWLRSMKRIQKETQSERMKKNCEIAYDKYIASVETAIDSIAKPLKLKDWTRAGKAMADAFRINAAQTRE